MSSTISSYPRERTALIVVDALNDFISEGGKLWGAVKDTVQGSDMLAHMTQIIRTARAVGIPVVHAPMETNEWDYSPWKNLSFTTKSLGKHHIFEAGTWGAEFHPSFLPEQGDAVVVPHKAFDAFHGTDLDTQLRQRGVDHVILVGMAANTCIESTGRAAFERGFHITFVTDAVGSFSWEAHKAAIEHNWPRFAHEIVSTQEVVELLNNSKRDV